MTEEREREKEEERDDRIESRSKIESKREARDPEDRKRILNLNLLNTSSAHFKGGRGQKQYSRETCYIFIFTQTHNTYEP